MGKGKHGQGLSGGDGIRCEAPVEFARSRNRVSEKRVHNVVSFFRASGSSSRDCGESRDKHHEQCALQEMDELLNRMEEKDLGADGSRFYAGDWNSRGESDEAKNNMLASMCEKRADEDHDVGKSGARGPDSVVYSAPQHRGWRDAATVFCVAGILVPVFTVFPIVIYYSFYKAVYAHYLGGPVLTTVILYIALASAMWTPAAYSETFKKVLLRPIMFELLSYVKGFKVLKEQKLASDKNYIFCWHPHGRLFYGFATFCGLFDAIVCPELGHAELFGGINDLMFSLPVVGVLLRLSGMIPCGRRHVDRKLREGNNVGLIIGGVEEVLEGTFVDKDVLFLLRRKGFVKVAMDAGVGLVPVYSFGENSLFKHEPKWILDFWNMLNKYVKVGAPFPIRGPVSLPIPFREELIIAVGAPIFAREGETVDSMHARYVDAVRDLYKRNVEATSSPAKKLHLV